ncbi:hypothetical protein ACQP00_21735 [Dactylosporangium sp. CS-047395]|uniref:hypothetical protein n=1 Tax=Dactylosporangium sp. CS-047395 TaxID=3239936 RepID=UPI003D9184D7
MEALGVRMGWPVAELRLVKEDRQMVACTARWVTIDASLDGCIGLPGRVCRDGRPGWIPNLAAATASLHSRAAARIGLHVAVGVPIATAGRVLGALCVTATGSKTPRTPHRAARRLGRARRAVPGTPPCRRTHCRTGRTKDEFLALATPDLRNPLTALTSTLALLDDALDGLRRARLAPVPATRTVRHRHSPPDGLPTRSGDRPESSSPDARTHDACAGTAVLGWLSGRFRAASPMRVLVEPDTTQPTLSMTFCTVSLPNSHGTVTITSKPGKIDSMPY